MKLGATPAEVSFATAFPPRPCTTTPPPRSGRVRPGAASPRDSNQPTAVPTRNGHAVSAMPATVRPFGVTAPAYRAEDDDTDDVGRERGQRRTGLLVAIDGIGHHVQFHWHDVVFVAAR